ncbi:hypothetical protein FVEN_g1128 [Fusarium venenatum]|uniref:Uncharacterized protein n=1 Tax=Fusarium venenatum TaxID=56646 RepID=A0A2L2THB2_9HYPO|nr:uncharacterized protein FVRRES_10439 [Fusarium venenatum]KAG8361102.1 hypothetical protein FVEN_g1128 [Fusarium venenatum]KAH6967044.1 hypothetical protein EDB82DRAFT_481335 [Fusarium venenatum]CEI70362.1 unnamed protein product [Fusarium venenatum]
MDQSVIPVLTISLSRHLHNRDINEGLKEQWSEANVATEISSRFTNIGFNLNADGSNLGGLKIKLEEREWSGIIIGWCARGNIEFTELFESTVAICVDHIVLGKQGNTSRKEPKLIFCRGPQDLVNATLRNFPLDD